MQATFLRPLCVLRGSFFVRQRAVTPGESQTHKERVGWLFQWLFMNTLLTFETFAFGHTNNIYHLILHKHILHRYGFLKVLPRPVHLLPEEHGRQC